MSEEKKKLTSELSLNCVRDQMTYTPKTVCYLGTDTLET